MHTEGEHVKGPDPVVLAASAPGVLEGALRLRRPVACLVPVPKPILTLSPNAYLQKRWEAGSATTAHRGQARMPMRAHPRLPLLLAGVVSYAVVLQDGVDDRQAGLTSGQSSCSGG